MATFKEYFDERYSLINEIRQLTLMVRAGSLFTSDDSILSKPWNEAKDIEKEQNLETKHIKK